MKKLLIICFYYFFNCLLVNAQVQGSFYCGINDSGIKYIYFKGINTTSGDLSISVYATNEMLNQRKDWNFTLSAGNSFTIGPENDWNWQKGERFWIQYQDGELVSWLNSYSVKTNSNPAFRGNAGRYCTGDYSQCSCPGYERYSPADWHCKHCGHLKNWHKF